MRMISRSKQILILGQGRDQHGWGIAIYKNTDSEGKFRFYSSLSNMEGKGDIYCNELEKFKK
jgi:hypothetical protein